MLIKDVSRALEELAAIVAKLQAKQLELKRQREQAPDGDK